jgi:hypothetical protein
MARVSQTDDEKTAQRVLDALLGHSATITIQMRGEEDGERVRLNDFITQLAALKDALLQTERLLYGTDGSVYYRIIELRQQSPALLTIEAVSKPNQPDNRGPIIGRFFSYLEALTRKDPSARAEMDLSALQAFKNLATTKNRHISELRVGNLHTGTPYSRDFALNQDFASAVSTVIGPDELAQGSVLGALEMINLHNTPRFAIFQTLGNRKVTCNFPVELKGTVIAALEKYVKVTGTLHFKKWDPRPHEIDAASIEVYPDESELPQLTDLAGLNPDIVDGMASEDFLAAARHAAW